MASTSGCELRIDDFKELSSIYGAEFNRPEMHDRVLVLDVFSDNTKGETKVGLIHLKEENSYSNGEVASCANVTTCAISKATEKNPINVDLSASVETRKSAEKRRPNSDGDIVLRRKKPKIDHEFDVKSKVNSETPSTEKKQVISQHEIFVHSSWLSVHSSYFRALFYSGLKESNLKEVHLNIPESEESAHLHLIEAMYNLALLNELPVNELLSIIVLAHKYHVKFVFRKCKYVLGTKANSVKLCEEIFEVVHVKHQMVDIEDLIGTIQVFLAKEFSHFDNKWETPSFVNLSENLLTLLLEATRLIVSCKDVVFHALMYWIKNNPRFSQDNPKQLTTSRLLSVVRFQLLTTSYLLSVVQHHPIAKQMANFNDFYFKAVSYAAIPGNVVCCEFMNIDAPEIRSSTLRDIVHFHWKMPRKVVFKNLMRLTSQPFWTCGYKMQLSLYRKSYSLSQFLVDVTLTILNLTGDAFTSIWWELKCGDDMVFKYDFCDDDEFVFSVNQPSRDKEGSFRWAKSKTRVLDLIMNPCNTTIVFT